MARLDFSLEMRSNAEHMSPSGKVPFVKAGKFVVAEMDPIVAFVNSKVSTRSVILHTMPIQEVYMCYELFNSLNYILYGYRRKLHISQGVGLTDHLDTAQKADMRAYMSLITNVLGNAEVIKFYLHNLAQSHLCINLRV